MVRIELGRRSIVIIAAAVALVAAVGIGYAAVPSTDGVITACLKKDGNLRVLDAEAADDCKKHDQLLHWNAQGPQGIQGEQGPQGEQGLQVLRGIQGRQRPSRATTRPGRACQACCWLPARTTRPS